MEVDLDFKAKQISNLKVHIETPHGNFTFSCDQCDYKAQSITRWMQQIEVTHRIINFPFEGEKMEMWTQL